MYVKINMLCNLCNKSFDTSNALYKHRSYYQGNCNQRIREKQVRKRQKVEAKEMLSTMDPVQVVESVNSSLKTNELLAEISQQNAEISKQNRELKRHMEEMRKQNGDIQQQNDEIKDMMKEMCKNPQLVILCNTLHPLQSLQEIDLREPRFKPVLEILDKELPEYANLANKPTGRVHCKAVRQLNCIQPTAIQDAGTVFFKKDDVLLKDGNHETTKAFIEVMAKTGYSYAQKADKDLKSTRESDNLFKQELLENACKEALPDVDSL
jgi:predicted RNase H-like nuclease (RuvC/YqgF family)